MLSTENRQSPVLNRVSCRDPWLITMDWTLGTDQSLQDMLDCDIKSEIDSVIGGHPELGFNFTELSPLELDDGLAGYRNDLNSWFGSQSLLNCNSNSSSSNFNFDITGCDAASMMVNPKSVMPHMSACNLMPSKNILVSSITDVSNTDGVDKRHFAFLPQQDIKREKPEEVLEELDELFDPSCIAEIEEAEADNEAEPESDGDPDFGNELSESDEEGEEEEVESEQRELGVIPSNGAEIKLNLPMTKAKTNLLLPTNNIKTLSPQVIKVQQSQQRIFKVNSMNSGIRLQSLKILHNREHVQQLHNQLYNRNIQAQVTSQHQVVQQLHHHLSPLVTSSQELERDSDPLAQDCEEKPYPKPAYSYSCLIAMALKNSQTGSLPVSEIYNFMCEHFPYFKTAPNGWKNSVRHNLSLNKCFEKIEKPTGNGNQRKGCLWAINPAKIAKMDEEVQKWSRKDPLAIKKAMIYPEQLELLERGEMKYVASGSSGELSEETESSADEADGPDKAAQPHGHTHTFGLGHPAANSVTDSYDESSQDCDVDVGDQVYDDIDIDEHDNKDTLHIRLNMSKESSLEFQLTSSAKRQKSITGTLQDNYVYQPVTTARRKHPHILTTSIADDTESFLNIE